jgi:transcriptional regulator with XRE-family HTH domain
MTEEGIRIGARLRAAREEAGLSQGQAAKLLEIEAGRRRVQADELSQFAKMYHVSVSWLLGEEGGVDPHEEKARVAARELMKLKAEDLDRVMNLVKSFRRDATALKGGKRR